jgi:two-component system cell cycle response regulator
VIFSGSQREMPKRQGPRRRPAKTIQFRDDGGDVADVTKRFASVTVVKGAEVDLGAQVVCDRPVTIGRDDDIELPLRDGSISRRHCRVEHDPDQDRYVLVDLTSTNGTRLNGARVEAQAPVTLADGDKIFLGSTVVKFGFADELDARYQAWLESLAQTDALTGLPSSRKFDAAFRAAVDEAREARTHVAVLVMDMDGLKQVNDAHGHQMGGFILAEVAALLRQVIERAGQVCRFGGDEFMSYLPGHDRAAALRVAEAARRAVEEHVFARDGVELRASISIGLALFPEDGADPDALFRVADRALYRAKAAGRNRVA